MPDTILTCREVLGLSPDGFVRKVWEGREKTFPLPTSVDISRPAYATVNAAEIRYQGNWQGRWVFICECGGAEYVDPADERVFCLSCYNIGSGGQWRPVIFPREREEIEAVLLSRPGQYRNFLPGETLDDLKSQNVVIEAAA